MDQPKLPAMSEESARRDAAGPPRRGGAWADVLRRPYDWILRWADHPAGPLVLVLMAILEACVFPAPTEAMFIALALGRPRRSWWFAGLASAASVTGGLMGYYVGAALFDEIARPVLSWYGLTDEMDAVARVYRENVFIALATSGYTPIPYMLYTIAGGAFGIPLVPFVLGSVVGRGIKYLILGALTFYLGPPVRAFLDRHSGWIVAVLGLLLVLAFLFLRG
jgi:membrane protein YqaA with SNARE-associated domain